jgi:hypothetical protein
MPRLFRDWPMLLLLPLAACQRQTAVSADAGRDTPATTVPSTLTTTPAPAAVASVTAPSRAAPANAPAPLARFDGYGDLRFGMREAEAVQAWGGELKPLPAASEPCHYLTPKWTKVPADFALMIEGGRLVRYDVGTAREAAPGGGRVGMTINEIERRYQGGVEHRPHKYVEGAEVLRVADPAGGKGVLVFETGADGKVTAWRAGVPPQVDYVEGCS